MKQHAAFLVLLFAAQLASGQSSSLNGTYEYALRKEFYSTFYFHKNEFTLAETGSRGAFYGKGKYKISRNKITLVYDTLKVDKKKLGTSTLIPPKTDTMILRAADKDVFEVEYELSDGTRVVQRYRKKKK